MNVPEQFIYGTRNVRVLQTEDGDPLFVAADVCAVLDLNNVTEALRGLDEDEKAIFRIPDREGRAFPSPVITESGLYSLVIRSRKPEAKQFKRWVTHEVLPSIRKHGAYATPDTIEQILADPDYGIRLLQTLKEERQQRQLAEEQRDEAVRTKALIGSKREATAMAAASAAVRKVEALERRLGEAKDWKQVKAIPWLRDYFELSGACSGAWSQIGRELSNISKELGLEIRRTDDSVYGHVHVYSAEAIHELQHRLDTDAGLLSRYRKTLRLVPKPEVRAVNAWMTVRDIPWLDDVFHVTDTLVGELCHALQRLSRQMRVASIPTKEANDVDSILFHKDVVEALLRLIDNDPQLFQDYRKDAM